MVDSVDAYWSSSPAEKSRFSGYEALKHLDPEGPLLVGGYGLNGPGILSLREAANLMVSRRAEEDVVFRGTRPLASWARRAAAGRPAGAFSYSFHFASPEEQAFLRPYRDRHTLW